MRRTRVKYHTRLTMASSDGRRDMRRTDDYSRIAIVCPGGRFRYIYASTGARSYISDAYCKTMRWAVKSGLVAMARVMRAVQSSGRS